MKKFLSILLISIFIFIPVFSQPKIAVVLSGGGAKGLAEVPLLEALEEEGIYPDMVLGTSMGALVGSLYSAGYSPKQIREIMLKLDFLSILNDKPASLEGVPPEAFSTKSDAHAIVSVSASGVGNAPGIIGDQNIIMELTKYMSRVLTITDFDKLPIPYRSVGTDVSSGEQIIFSKGSLVDAVRASISLPGIFTPAPVNDGTGRYAMDGGLRNNIPIELAKSMGADIVIAMDVASIVDTDPTTLDNFSAVAIQIFNLIISNNAVEQYKSANLVLRPDVGKFSTLGFNQAEGIINAGQECVDQNREEIKKIVQELEAAGYERKNLPYNRTSAYDEMKDLEIESIEVRDISFAAQVPLPDEKNFEKFIGKTLDEKTKLKLTETLDNYRSLFHLSSFTYYLKPGSTKEKAVLELRANHYNLNTNKVYAAGGGTVFFSDNNRTDKFAILPNFTLGTYVIKPIPIHSRINIGSLNSFELDVLPKIAENDSLIFSLDLGGALKYGSLEPRSDILYVDRFVNKDSGSDIHAGFMISYADLFSFKAGIKYDYNWINSRSNSYHLVYNYASVIYSTMRKDFTSFSGKKFEALLHTGSHQDDEVLFDARLAFKHNFELIKNTSSIGYFTGLTYMEFPYQLTMSYGEYGGLDGMCGHPYGQLQRQFALAGLNYQHSLFEFAGMPLVGIIQTSAGIRDKFDPYTAVDAPVRGLGSTDDYEVEIGAGLYVSLKTLSGNVILGGSFNSSGDWNIMIGFK